MATNPNRLPPQVEAVIGSESLELKGRKIDLRSRQGRRWRDHVRRLAEQMGGEPTASQGLLLSRCATLALLVEQADAALLDGRDIDQSAYVRNSNALRAILIQLGLAAKSRDVTKGDQEPADEHAALIMGG